MGISVQAAIMSRLMSLPAGFFKNYSSGELSARAQCINSLCQMLASAVLTTGLTSVFSLVYISQIFVYAPALVIPSLFIMLATVVFTVISALVQMKVSKKKMELSSKESGMSVTQIINTVIASKICVLPSSITRENSRLLSFGRAYVCIFACIHIADFCVRARAGNTVAFHYACYSGVYSDIVP